MKKRYLTLFLCAVLIIACATSPTGRRQLMIVSEDRAIAASKEAYVEMIKPYEKKGKVDNDPALKDRVYQITGRLIAQAIEWRPETKNWEWSIKVIDVIQIDTALATEFADLDSSQDNVVDENDDGVSFAFGDLTIDFGNGDTLTVGGVQSLQEEDITFV